MKRNNAYLRKLQKGFTLIEMVVVIAIIGVLAAIIVPSVMNYIRKSQRRVDTANAKQIWTAIQGLLADDYVAHDYALNKSGKKKGDWTTESSFFCSEGISAPCRMVDVYSHGNNKPEQYKLCIVAMCVAKKGGGGKDNYGFWNPAQDEHTYFVEKLNGCSWEDAQKNGKKNKDQGFVGDSTEFLWPMKYLTHKDNVKTDCWIIGWRVEDQRVEIWSGNTTASGGGGKFPVYRVWPDPCDEYTNEYYDSPYNKPNDADRSYYGVK